jgi:hypothetical protein
MAGFTASRFSTVIRGASIGVGSVFVAFTILESLLTARRASMEPPHRHPVVTLRFLEGHLRVYLKVIEGLYLGVVPYFIQAVLEGCLSASFDAWRIGSDTDGVQFIVEDKGCLLSPKGPLIVSAGGIYPFSDGML